MKRIDSVTRIDRAGPPPHAKQHRLIIALLEEPTLEKAAAAAGMSISTAYRLKQDPEFQAEFREQRDQAFGDGVSRLQAATGVAVSTILDIMKNPKAPASVRLRAAGMVIAFAVDGNFEEMRMMLEDVEAARAKQGGRRLA